MICEWPEFDIPGRCGRRLGGGGVEWPISGRGTSLHLKMDSCLLAPGVVRMMRLVGWTM